LFLLPAAAWGALRLQATSNAGPATSSATSNPTTPNPTTPNPTTPNPTTPTSIPTPNPTTPTSGPTPSPTPSASPTPNPSAISPAATGQLFLVGDPGSEVAVDSGPFRPCPAAITVKAGSHQVRFAFGYATTHDSVGREVSVAPGERVTVRADFTAAVPRIRVEH
jgi:hypothetical protein